MILLRKFLGRHPIVPPRQSAAMEKQDHIYILLSIFLYVYTLRILKANLGRRRVADVKAMDIEVLLRKLRRDGRSDSCLAQCRGMLFQIFNKAEANDLVNKNPVRFAEKMRKRPPKRKDAFTAEEVRRLLKELPENKIGWSIRLLLCTGMRTQELLGLEPRHIAEDGSIIVIEQAVVMEKGTAMIGTPKSFDSYRSVPVPPQFRYCARLLRDTDKKFVWEMDKRLDYPCNPSTFRPNTSRRLNPSLAFGIYPPTAVDTPMFRKCRP